LIRKWIVRISAVIVLVILPEIAIAKSPHPSAFKAHTRFLATSTCIRGTWGLNLDVYLAEIVPIKGSDPVLVRLIDEYRDLDPPLSVATLTSRREQLCRLDEISNAICPMAVYHFVRHLEIQWPSCTRGSDTNRSFPRRLTHMKCCRVTGLFGDDC